MIPAFKYRINNTNTILVMVFVLFAFTLKAQTDSAKATVENKKLELEELVVTGQYGENTLAKSVYKIKIIDAKRIQLQGAFNLQQLLVNELNIRINQDPILGSSVQLQGVGGNNIKILIDGVPVIGRENGNIDLTQINLNNVERIELVEGPMSVNFGTDALGGVINIITKKQKVQSTRASLNTYYESIGQYNADVNVGLSNQKYNVTAGVGRNFFEGYSADASSRVKLWKPRTQYTADVVLGKFISNGNIRWSNQLFNEKVTDKGEENVDWTHANATDRYYNSTRYTSSLFFDKKYKSKIQINMVASYNFYERRQNTYYTNLVDMSRVLTSTTDQDTNRFHQIMSRGTFSNVKGSKKINYQLGYEINEEIATGKRIVTQTQQIGDYSLFGSSEIKILPRLLIRPGMRLTYNSRFKVPLIPSINLKYDVTDLWTIRSSYARGFRAPSLKELSLQFVDNAHNILGNANLIPETSDNFQLSVSYQNKTDKRIWRFEPVLFYNHIQNMIDLKRIINTDNTLNYQYFNINNFYSTGLNINAEYKNRYYQVTAGFARTGKQNNLLQNAINSPYFFSNEWRLNMSYLINKYDASINAFFKINGKTQIYQYNYLSDAVVLSFIDAFSLLDLSINKNFMKKKLAITLGSKNLLNVVNVNANFISGPHNSSNFAMTGLGRTFFIGIRYSI